MLPLISVVIPTYKERGGLRDSIKSVLNQSYTNIEVIVVDDNDPTSKERELTEGVMLEFTANKKVIYQKHKQNKNGSAARNTGIYNSKGDYISFLDDDDIFLPDKLSKQIEYLQAHPNMGAVYSFASRDGVNNGTTPHEGDVSKYILLLESEIYTSTLMFRRDCLIEQSGFDETFYRHQDYELLLRFFGNGHKIGCVKDILTELGGNNGENIPSGESLNTIKDMLFNKFKAHINRYELDNPKFANKVYVTHYVEVFISHLKHRHIYMATKVFIKYFPLSPNTFTSILYHRVKNKL